MFLDLAVGVITAANAFIAIFIVVYAFMFLNKTKSHKDRRPWDYLFLASIIYLLYTMFLMLLELYNIQTLFGILEVYQLSIFFQFIYTGLILLSFISQTDLILNNDLIVIMKKHGKDDVAPKTAELQVEPAIQEKEKKPESESFPAVKEKSVSKTRKKK